jgi:hypothetical protein
MSVTVEVGNLATDPTTGIIEPKVKISAQTLLHDLWDTFHKRYRSGVLVVTITQIYWTGTKGAGETATITINPPNYQQNCNDQITLRPVVTAVSSGTPVTPNFKHVTAVNYGMPDSSAVLNPDGTFSLVEVVIELNSNAITPIASLLSVFVTYNLAWHEYSPYSPIEGTGYEADLSIGNGSSTDWGMATVDATTGYAALVVQLATLDWSVLPGNNPSGLVPSFQLSNPARPGGATVANYNTALAQSFGRSLTFYDSYTYVFAVNDGKVDANATPVQATDIAIYNLCNFGLTAPDASGTDTATATLTYLILTATM